MRKVTVVGSGNVRPPSTGEVGAVPTTVLIAGNDEASRHALTTGGFAVQK